MRLAVLALAACAHAAPSSTAIAIRNVTIVDGVAGARPAMTVVLDGAAITAVGPVATTSIPAGARTIDGRGRFVIPGLWDMHIHLIDVDEPAFGVLVAHGVTSVRDMGGPVDQLRAWRDRIAAGTLVGPRIAFCGPMLEGAPDGVPAGRTDHELVTDPAAAEATVARLAAAGVDCIKMRGYANEPTYRALVAAAHAHRLPLVGHPPYGLDPLTVTGQASLEHGFYPWPWDDLGADRRRAIADAWRRAGTLVTPTLVAWHAFLVPDAEIEAAIAGTTGPLRWITPRLRANWRTGFADMQHRRKPGPPPGNREAWETALAAAATQIRELHDRGVGVLVGTDTGTPLTIPGQAVHDELALLVERAGLRPLDALLGATLIPAKHLGLERELGTIAPGKRADLVLLAADPLADIRNTREIEAVVLAGRLFDRAALDRMLAR